MIAAVPSSTLLGVDGHPVSVEVHVSNGLPGCTIVGLPDASCREARDRVRAAFLSSGLTWPQTRITINLAPSNLRKVGTAFDLAIAVGVLMAENKVPADLTNDMGFVGELGLDGAIRSVDGIVPLVDAIKAPVVVVPERCMTQASVVPREIRGVSSLSELVAILTGHGEWLTPPPLPFRTHTNDEPDLAEVRGQALPRWAIEVAAAGGHNLLLIGPPGSGKTMLARRLPGLLPDLDDKTALVATRVHSAAGALSTDDPLVFRPPFRSPHHTASKTAIIGGGSSFIRPGEASLAHGGVLFLDEMAEFPRSVLDTLRQPLESGALQIGRANFTVDFPARFLLVGATNPCPCGEGMTSGSCRCGDATRNRYMERLSGPLLDRFDLRVHVMRPQPEQFFERSRSESSASVAERVASARNRARRRRLRCNADIPSNELDRWASLSDAASAVLSQRMRHRTLTARGLDRVRRVALTLADLEATDERLDEPLTERHVCAALELRPEPTVSAVA